MTESESGEDVLSVGSFEEDESYEMGQEEDDGGSDEAGASSGEDQEGDGDEQDFGSGEDDEEEGDSDSGEEEAGEDSGDDDDGEDVSDEEDDENFQTRSKNNAQQEIEKGKAVQHQLRVWDSLLEIRIRLQQILIHANKLPQPEQLDSICPSGVSERQGTKLAVSDLLDELIEMKERMLSNNPETDGSETGKAKPPVDDDEEILSSEDEDIAKVVKPIPQKKPKRHAPKRRKLEEYEIDVQKKYQSLAQFRNQTIQKWNDRTQVASGKFNKKSFSAFQISTIKQIEQILGDRERLIRRTQLKRSNYEIIGKPEILKSEDPEAQENETAMDQEHDPEIFDDDDFYHQLLRELIERKTSSVTDPVQLSRHWLELQKFRSKMKRKVDTKASKARKIRYDVIPKLINFMAPVDECPMTDHAMNELFSSLFGQHK